MSADPRRADPVVSPADTIRQALNDYLPDGFRDEDGVWHDGPVQSDALVALDALLAVGERDKAALGEEIATLADAVLKCQRARERDRRQIARLTEALTHVGDGTLDNLCWCGEEWIGDDDPLDEEREHSEWCLRARAVLAGEKDAE